MSTTVKIRMSDAPRAGEIDVAVSPTSGGRSLPRVGGLALADVIGEDGLVGPT